MCISFFSFGNRLINSCVYGCSCRLDDFGISDYLFIVFLLLCKRCERLSASPSCILAGISADCLRGCGQLVNGSLSETFNRSTNLLIVLEVIVCVNQLRYFLESFQVVPVSEAERKQQVLWDKYLLFNDFPVCAGNSSDIRETRRRTLVWTCPSGSAAAP